MAHGGRSDTDLLDASAAGGAVARERAEQLVREVIDLYGAGLGACMRSRCSRSRRRRAAWPPTIWWPACCWCTACTRTTSSAGSPMPWTACGPTSARTAVTSNCSKSSGDGGAACSSSGSCKSCPSSAVTLELAVEDAVRAAAPEMSRSKWLPQNHSRFRRRFPAESLLSRVHATGTAQAPGTRLPTSPTWPPARSAASRWRGTTVLACRVGDDLFAYHDRCGSCGESLAGAVLHRAMAGRRGAAVPAVPRALRRGPRRSGADGNGDASSIWSRYRCWPATACCRAWRSRGSP